MKKYFVFDCESIGLHGETFAVGGGVYLSNGEMQWEFSLSCDPFLCAGTDSSREWVKANIPKLETTHTHPKNMRERFWDFWLKARLEGATAAVDCGWPVEARFLIGCVKDHPEDREFAGPYPLHEISSVLAAAAMDPMEEYTRLPSELPKHNPLNDARQSARLLAEAISRLP